MWEKAELGDKQRFQNLLFPQGFYFDKENKHIEPLTVNRFFCCKPLIINELRAKEKGTFL
jgi:hypothetical protein